ncbi:MAG: hypothetical protein U0359_12135 [Byssovorax sp.]
MSDDTDKSLPYLPQPALARTVAFFLLTPLVSLLFQIDGRTWWLPFAWILPAIYFATAAISSTGRFVEQRPSYPWLRAACALGLVVSAPLATWMTIRWLHCVLPLLTSPEIPAEPGFSVSAILAYMTLFAVGFGAAALAVKRSSGARLIVLMRVLAWASTVGFLILLWPAIILSERTPSPIEASALHVAAEIPTVIDQDPSFQLLADNKEAIYARRQVGSVSFEQRCTRQGCHVVLIDPNVSTPAASTSPSFGLDHRVGILQGPRDDVFFFRSAGRLDMSMLDADPTVWGSAPFVGAVHRIDGKWAYTGETPASGYFRRVRPPHVVHLCALGLPFMVLAWVARLRAKHAGAQEEIEGAPRPVAEGALALRGDAHRWEVTVVLITCVALPPLVATVLVLW